MRDTSKGNQLSPNSEPRLSAIRWSHKFDPSRPSRWMAITEAAYLTPT